MLLYRDVIFHPFKTSFVIRVISKMNFATFDLNLLRILDMLLREGSTVKAGERLGLSQSAVSGALARLRHALQDPLFVRQGNRLVATDYARALAAPLQNELDRLQVLLSTSHSFEPATETGSFKITGSDFFADLLMPALAADMGQAAPGVRVQLVDLVPNDYLGSLERYNADLALIPNTMLPEWVDSRPVFYSDFVTIARQDNPRIVECGVQPGSAIPLDLYCDLGHVLFSPEGNLGALGDAALAGLNRTRQVSVTMPVFSGVCRVVGKSDLVALIPRQLAERVCSQFGLQIYLPPMPLEPVLILACWHKRVSHAPFHKWMRNRVCDLLSPLNDGDIPLP